MHKKTAAVITAALMICSLAACTGSESTASRSGDTSQESTSSVNSESNNESTAEVSAIQTRTSDVFSDRDLAQTVDVSDAKTISVSNGNTVKISEDGIYVLTGTATECTVLVETDSESKVQLVLDGLNITNTSAPAIYVLSADKCFVTTTDSENSLGVTGAFSSDDGVNTDAVIFSKADLILNGVGTMNVTSSQGNGISGKDDVKITGGTFNITSALDGIESNDLIALTDASVNIESSKDGMHCENNDDDSIGEICIFSGKLSVKAASDAVQAGTFCSIYGGTLDLSAEECLEATGITISDGKINISATDNGINVSLKSNSCGNPTLVINGGEIKVTVEPEEADAIDVNGDITINGGTIDITATNTSFDYEGTASFNGGTIIINGTQVDSIPAAPAK